MKVGRVVLVLAFLVLSATPGRLVAQGVGELMQAIVVELKFKDDKVEFVEKSEREAFVPRQYGVPQMAPLFFEALGGKEGEVIYCGEISDPRDLWVDGGRPSGPDQSPGGMVRLEEATLSIAIPATVTIKTTELVVYRRSSENSESGRTVLVRVGL